MEEQKNDHKMPLTEKWAVFIVGFCFVLLIICGACFVVNKTIFTPKVGKLEIRMIPDSLSTETTYSKKEVDSLITLTKQTLDSYQKHFETEIVQKEQEDVNKSLVALLVSVIVGLCGFFGFKSFKDIQEKGEQTAKETANDIAKDVAETAANKAAETYLERKLPEVVEKQFEKSFKATMVNSFKDSVKTEVIPQILQELSNSNTDGTAGEVQEGDASNEYNLAEPMTPDEMFDQQH